MTDAAEPQKAPVVAEAHLVDTFRKPEQNPNFLAPFLVYFWSLAPNSTERLRLHPHLLNRIYTVLWASATQT